MEDFISRKDRIIAAAIDIISEAGLSALTTENLAIKENISENLLYKYYLDINELLVDVVDFYAKFDKSIQKTIQGKTGRTIDRIYQYVEAYATYYDNYYAVSTLMLQYEELLHNVYTREKMAECLQDRGRFLTGMFQEALDQGELIDTFTAAELADTVTGTLMKFTLNRRIEYNKESFKTEFCRYMDKWFKLISKN
jgi:AcrR family transcriptional regulator